MWLLISAIVTASLLGSTHCVGMCGPLALWASGTTDASRSNVAANTALYHLGRLFAYATMGCLAGIVGELVDVGGNTIGLRMAAARFVGGSMIALGLWRVVNMLWHQPSSLVVSAPSKPSLIGRLISRIRPLVFRLPMSARAAVSGLLTAFLPCGWLYLFAFVAAGTASPAGGVVVMISFWVGTLPLLIGLIAGASLLNERFKKAIPIAASILLIGTGYYTATSTAFASTDSLSKLKAAAKRDIRKLPNTPLPCCCQSPEESCQTP